MWAMAIHAHTRTREKCKLVEIEMRELIKGLNEYYFIPLLLICFSKS
jgi:hypothetical protein